MPLDPQIMGLVMQVVDEEEADFEDMMMNLARIAAAELMELEEGEGFDGLVGNQWVPITVNLDEYHLMGDPCFGLHFRMTRAVFEALTEIVHGHLIDTGRLRRRRTRFQDIMLMVVWVLATPDSFRSIALRFGVRPSTLYYFYAYVIEALRELAPQYISWPNEEEREVIKETFFRATGFPGIVGCIDCTAVYVTAPVVDAAQYRNRHDTYSLNIQAVVDSTLLVRDLHVGEVGSMHDSRVFRRSPLGEDLLQGGGRVTPDEHLVGDGAYVLTDYMMVPFANNGHLNPAQLNFNRQLSQSRVRVENAFARAKGKWRRIKFLHARNQEIVVDHITASFVLHNFIILNGQPLFDEEELMRPIHNNEVLGNENFPEEDEPDVDELLHAAQGRGVEKRQFIMDNLHNFDEA